MENPEETPNAESPDEEVSEMEVAADITPAPVDEVNETPEGPGEETTEASAITDTDDFGEYDSVAIQGEGRRRVPRTVVIGFILVLIVGVVAFALFQYNRGLGSPFGLSGIFGGGYTTESGVEVQDTTAGTGDPIEAGDAVVVHYTGWLEDGTEFDSSYSRGQPSTFILGYGFVIPGWDDGLLGMKPGGVRRMTIPPEQGYGELGAGDVIPPNETLTFEVELLDVYHRDVVDLVEGEGAEAVPGSGVVLEYTLWLMDGTEIDSSATSGQPLAFTLGLGQILPGIEQGIVGMQVGGKRLVTIPPELAFGEEGLTDLIPPNSALQFEFELTGIQ
jgi:FKBP-type peptidyl-prolyl cis-trans isomerase